jgi:DNA modification methylase
MTVQCLNEHHGANFAAYHGDCVDVFRQLPDDSVHLSVYSPPFSGLYIYNDSVADMGNCADDAEFVEHYRFLVRELYRVTKPGRICAVHCKDLVYYRTQRGTAGLRDFPGMLIQAHIDAGFDFHSRITVWRCPVREMTKTKAHGLLYKQLRADSSFSRQGLPEYFVVFRKWADEGDAVQPVTHTSETFPLPQWQEYASPVWMDTRETDVLNVDAARAPGDEKHICPMPLDLTTRVVTLWSNPGEVVASPFMGIGSEGVVALRMGRRYIGTELKESYWRQACRYLDFEDRQVSLFGSHDRLPHHNTLGEAERLFSERQLQAMEISEGLR